MRGLRYAAAGMRDDDSMLNSIERIKRMCATALGVILSALEESRLHCTCSDRRLETAVGIT